MRSVYDKYTHLLSKSKKLTKQNKEIFNTILDRKYKLPHKSIKYLTKFLYKHYKQTINCFN